MSSFFRLLLLIVLIAACVALAGGAWAAFRLPEMAEAKFGPPSRSLSISQRAIYSFRLLSNETNLVFPVDRLGSERTFSVALGESVGSVAVRLEDEGLIPDAEAFRTYLIYTGMDTAIQAGKYRLSPSMTPVAIARKLQDPVPEDVAFSILPGWRLEEIAASLPTSGLEVSPDEFLQVAYNPSVHAPVAEQLPEGLPALDSLEGFMLPGSYVIKRETSAEQLAALFLARFNEDVSQEMLDGFSAQGLDLYEAVTLASIVEREAMVEEEQPVIASVFYNRLASGWRLESDPTAQYALGYDIGSGTWWRSPLSSADVQVDSPYNTYRINGLPPGPISSPGIEALQAVAFPAQTDYFFFRAQCNRSGRHNFSVTYDEHLANACP